MPSRLLTSAVIALVLFSFCSILYIVSWLFWSSNQMFNIFFTAFIYAKCFFHILLCNLPTEWMPRTSSCHCNQFMYFASSCQRKEQINVFHDCKVLFQCDGLCFNKLLAGCLQALQAALAQKIHCRLKKEKSCEVKTGSPFVVDLLLLQWTWVNYSQISCCHSSYKWKTNLVKNIHIKRLFFSLAFCLPLSVLLACL